MVIAWLMFTVVVGACVGSFLNVVIYRLPAGLSIVRPPSACPKCGHRLAWHDNVPVLGWLWLKGRCRYCSNPISPQYPIIEAATAGLFGMWYAVCYLSPLRPDFAGAGLAETWLILMVYLALIAGLIAATVIDARLYIIPLEIPWTNTVIALILLPLATAVFPHSIGQPALPPHTVLANQRLENMTGPYRYSAAIEATVHHPAPQPAIAHAPRISPAPLVGDRAAAAGFGGMIALAVAVFLLWKKLLPRSFDDELNAEAQGPAPDADDADAADDALKQLPFVVAPALGAAAAVVGVDQVWAGGWAHTHVLLRLIVAVSAAYAVVILGGVAWRLRYGLRNNRSEVVGTTNEQPDAPPMAVFPPHPRPRREVGKECLFVAFPLLGATAGAWLAPSLDADADALRVLGGVMLGYLAGGAVVWATRIGGTLAFGKEAMSLGDVHLMAAVGAVGGWQVAVPAFFVAPFFGLVYAVLAVGLGGILRFRGHQIPYGPHLAVATFVVMIWREPLLAYFGALLNP